MTILQPSGPSVIDIALDAVPELDRAERWVVPSLDDETDTDDDAALPDDELPVVLVATLPVGRSIHRTVTRPSA